MWDVDGNRYIDASSGPICSNIGHGNQHVASATYQQTLKLDFALPPRAFTGGGANPGEQRSACGHRYRGRIRHRSRDRTPTG